MGQHRDGAKKPSRAQAERGPSTTAPWRTRSVIATIMLLVGGGWFAYQGLSRTDWPAALTSGSLAGQSVLLITLDTTRADHLGCYGDTLAATPVLDSLADTGIRFADAVTVAPVTLPAHTSILTGLSPPNHGVRNNGDYHLNAKHTTLAEILRGRGYETAAFVSAFVLDGRYGLDQGFSVYGDNVGAAAGASAGTFVKTIYERPAGDVTTEALRWLRKERGDRPFFCWVHYFDPHKPYRAPAAFARRFKDRPYDGEIAYMDSQIGRLVAWLRDSGAVDSTLVIVVADHGEGLGDHGEATHAKLIYDSVMHVPLLLSFPGVTRDGYVVDDVVVSVADIAPTVLDLLGIETDARFDGISLLAARTRLDRTIYLENLASYLDNGWSPLFGLRRHHDKYILAPKPEYYDLRADPGELKNLYADAAGAPKAARDRLMADLAQRLAKWPSVVEAVAAADPIDAEAVERLAALGYVRSVSRAERPTDQLPNPKDMMPVLQALDRADALARAGRYDAALAVLKDAAEASPKDPRLLLTLGKVYLFMERNADAETALRASLATHASARVCILLAQIMLADGRLDEAEAMLHRAESLDPKHGGIYLARGDLLALRRKPDEALASYARARQVDPYRAAAEADARITRLNELLGRSPRQP